MQSDRDRLNVDLGFLDGAKPREVQTQAASKYKVNWRNIGIIGGVIIVFLIWIASNDNTSNQRSVPATYAPPAADSAATVNNVHFSCSRYDSNQADLMVPKDEFVLNQEEVELRRRGDVVDS